MDESTSFREWLREHRKEYDYTQQELAQRIGCSVVTVRRIEEGVLRPSRQLAELIAAGLEVPPEEREKLVKWARSDPLKAKSFIAAASTLGTANGTAAVDTLHAPPPVGSASDMEHILANPYKGLRAFAEPDAPDFFGREAFTARLLARLSEDHPLSRFLAVVGPSGCGKSSVVRAGLIPALRPRGLPGGLHMALADITPGAHPLEELEAALLRIAPNPPPSLVEQLQADERGLIRAVKCVLPGEETGILLLIDQFEEIFSLVRDEAARSLLLNSLRAAVMEPGLPLWVVITLRADFYDGPLMYGSSYELVRERTEAMGALAADELHRAIVAPARRVGIELDDELVATLEQDMGERPGALPLLEYTLTELFERREDDTLPLEAYRATGGVQGALERRAEEIYASLDPAEQEETHQLFLRLVTLGDGIEDTRRRVRRTELASAARDEEALDRVLEIFGQARLLTFDRDLVTHGPTVEVAHEALIQAWARLERWLDESRANLQVQRELMSEATEWARSGKEASYLASGARLVQFQALAENESKPGGVALAAEEKEYLQASIEERDRQEEAERERQAKELVMQKRLASRLRTIVGGLAIFLVIAAALALFAFGQQAEATNQRNAAQANADRADRSAATAVANQNEANAQRNLAQQSQATAQANFARADALRLAAEANRLGVTGESDPQLIGLLAARSLGVAHTLPGDEALGNALNLPYPRLVFTGHMPMANVSAAYAWFSSDGKYVSSATAPDATAIYWDAQTGKEIARFQGDPTQVYQAAFLRNGGLVLTVNKDNTLTIWDAATHKPLHLLTGHTARPSFSLPQGGKTILTYSADKTARLWDVATGALLQTFAGHDGQVTAAAVSPDGKEVATEEGFTSSGDWNLRFWDLAGGEQLRRFLTGYTTTTGCRGRGLSYSPDGKSVLLACDTGEAWLLDTSTGAVTQRFTPMYVAALTSTAYSPDGKLVLTGSSDGTVRLWNAATGTVVRSFSGIGGMVWTVEFSPDGRSLLTIGTNKAAAIWDVQPTLEFPVVSAHDTGVLRFGISHDGARLVTVGESENDAKVWDVHTGALQLTLKGHTGPVSSAVFSPDDKTIATSAEDMTVRLWDAVTGKELRRIPETASVYCVTFSSNGKWLAIGSFSGAVIIVDVATSTELWRNEGHSTKVTGTAFSPDGKQVFAEWFDSTAALFDASTGKQLLRFAANAQTFYRGDYSPDGRYVMVGGVNAIYIWDAHTGALVRTLTSQSSFIQDCVFSADGKEVLAGLANKTVQLWDIATGQEVRRFAGFPSAVDAAAFTRDGKQIIVAGLDGTVRFAALDYHDSVDWLCGNLWRDFTADERTLYEIKDNTPTCPGR